MADAESEEKSKSDDSPPRKRIKVEPVEEQADEIVQEPASVKLECVEDAPIEHDPLDLADNIKTESVDSNEANCVEDDDSLGEECPSGSSGSDSGDSNVNEFSSASSASGDEDSSSDSSDSEGCNLNTIQDLFLANSCLEILDGNAEDALESFLLWKMLKKRKNKIRAQAKWMMEHAQP